MLSDMAPNISGVAATDQAKAMYLAELALEFVRAQLKTWRCFFGQIIPG